MTTQPQKILILAAIPYGLRLDKEIREIEEAIRRAVKRDSYEIRVRYAVRSQDIRRALAEEKPQIIHFCGHGMEDGSLVSEDEAGSAKPVKPEAIAELFKLHMDYVKCVLLNACYSEKTAEAITQHINYAIGMNQAITDMTAITFSQGFYDALGYGIQDNQNIYYRAFQEGKVAIQLENILESNTPVFKSKNNRNKQNRLTLEDSVDFFARRFAKAFPGVRGLKIFESPKEAVQRLAKLLEEPLVFEKFYPVGWFRGSAYLHISNFKILEFDTICLDCYELRINRVAAFNSGLDYQCFVYVEADPMEPIGLYTYTLEKIQESQKKLGYYLEEYAIFDDKHFITRAEYDDSACIINGDLIDLEDSKTELRVRYLTPYNFIICAIHSSINNTSFDSILEKNLNEILEGSSDLEILVKEITTLRKRKINL